jgi:hypothetical protein
VLRAEARRSLMFCTLLMDIAPGNQDK